MTLDLITGKNQKLFDRNIKRESVESTENKEVLPVDEVDVFFGSDFYGQTYNQATHLEDDLVESLIRQVWRSRNKHLSPRKVTNWNVCQSVFRRYPESKFLIESEITKMCDDVNKFKTQEYHRDNVNSRIGYVVHNNIEWDIVYGYQTAFAYLSEQENVIFIGEKADARVKESLRLAVSCGQIIICPHKSCINIRSFRHIERIDN